jgi:bifunctional DNA-binding transcriptional regulator/antitoxin component of YhaV-PrlF toxin-antitoxin module
VASLTVTAKGQVMLKGDLLQHLGIKPGERVDFEKLPGGELLVRRRGRPERSTLSLSGDEPAEAGAYSLSSRPSTTCVARSVAVDSITR